MARKLLYMVLPTRKTAALSFIEGNALLDQNRPIEAYRALSRCLSTSTDPHVFFVTAVCLMVGLGRYREALSAFSRANELRRQHARSLGLDGSNIWYLTNIWCGAFGHLAQMDYLIKRSILEQHARDDIILYIPSGAPVANRFLLDQWRPYLTIVERATDLPLPEVQMRALEYDFLAPRRANGTTVQLWEIAAQTYKRWSTESRGALLALPPEIVARGRAVLDSVGVPLDAWFVVLHIREASSKKHHADLHNVLNARIESYAGAIAEIVKRGGWVFRIGDESMAPLPPSANVIDYCHSSIRSEWMDVFLCAQARFFLGTSSGPAYVPPIYGVPAVLTNWWPPAQRPWHSTDIFLPKTYRNAGTGRILSLDESLEEPFGYCNSLDYLKEKKGVIVEDNDPEDIRLAVVEMMERLQGQANYDDEDVTLRRLCDEAYVRHGAIGMSLLARDFLRRNRDFVRCRSEECD